MRSKLTAIQLLAIKRYGDEHNCVPQLSLFPIVTFKQRETDVIFNENLTMLVYYHNTAKKEEQSIRASDKKKLEREEKWKPRSAGY